LYSANIVIKLKSILEPCGGFSKFDRVGAIEAKGSIGLLFPPVAGVPFYPLIDDG
jgi:hypothetical protein